MKTRIYKAFFFCCLTLWMIGFSSNTAAEEKKKDPPKKEFTVIKEVWRTPYKPQGKTGTCWSFSTTSFLESEAYRLGRGEFELSQIFFAYNAFLEKAQRNARMQGNGVFQDGGLPHDVIYLIKKYGAVPLAYYTGLLSGENKHNHREMSKILKGIMEAVIKIGEAGNLSSKWIDGELHCLWLDDMRDVLDNHLGPAPETIVYKGRKQTPKQFAEKELALPYDDYIEITSYSCLPFYGTGELTLPDNWLHYSNFYNVPIDDYIRILDFALGSGYSVVFDLHTTGKLYKSLKGYCELDPDLEEGVIDQERRDTMLENWSTIDQHLEHGVGLAKDQDGKKFYRTKDSVGEDAGPYKALEYLSENFVRAKALFFMVHKDGLPEDIRKRLGIE